MNDPVAADLLVNGVALVAVAAAAAALSGRRKAGAVERRLRALYLGLAFLLAVRMLYWTAPGSLLAVPVAVAASWMPLLILRLVEELLRRHAPARLKAAALGGAIAFTVAALATGALFPKTLTTALAAFQVALLLWTLGFILRGRRLGLAEAETRLVDTFAIALLLALPFAVTDFRDAFPWLPVRMGGVGVLIFALATSRLVGGGGSPRLLVADLAGLFLCAAAIGLGAALLLPELGDTYLWRLAALGLAAPAAMLVVQRLREARLAERLQPSLLSSLARVPDDPGRDVLLASHPLIASGTPLDGGNLELYDDQTIEALAAHRVVTGATPLDELAAGAARNLLDEYAATHLVRLSRDPPHFLALAAGQMGGAGPRDLELDMLSRLADRAR